MRKSIYLRFAALLCTLFGVVGNTRSQTAQQLMNAELRQFFSTIANPNPNVQFLYDMSAHSVDSAFFGTFVTDTGWTENWFDLYEEMYYAAYDTTLFQTAAQVLNAAQPFVQQNVFPIGLMDWDYNLLKPDALTTGTYFNFDTINHVITDIPGAPSPFTIQNVFAGTSIRPFSYFNNPKFMVNPQFIFRDAAKNYASGLEIDFGDGTGWHAFNATTTTYYTANYPAPGNHVIQFRYTDRFGANKYSLTRFSTVVDRPQPPATGVTGLPGITATFYDPIGCVPNAARKYVIYVEGIDFLEDRDAARIYDEMIFDERMSQLQNMGYTFVVVNWNNSYAPIQQNSQYLQGLIEHLKCNAGPNRDVPPPPFVIVGESMGGLVTRHALLTMEQQGYQSNCMNDIRHNTRLFISLDAPQAGANIPLGLQYMYKYYAAINMPLNALTAFQFNRLFNLLGGSARQMLIYHVNTDANPLALVSSSGFGPHADRTTLTNQLAAMGNYPRFCKLVSLSNGSGQGARQRRIWDGAPRQPNDRILDVHAEYTLRVLGIRIVGSVHDLRVNTNPAGNGDLFWARSGVSRWRIRLRWFGARLVWSTTNYLNIDKDGQNLRAHCVSAGSVEGEDVNLGAVAPVNSNDFPINLPWLFGFQWGGNGQGQLNASAYYGISWLVRNTASLSAYSDGGSFGFIPVQSSIDYGAQPGLDHNIVIDPVPTTIARTPFDVVFFNPTRFNRIHLFVERPDLNRFVTCVNLGQTVYPARSTLLNREIGDDTLYLENWRAGYRFRNVEAEQSVLVNFPNPYYNYPTLTSADGNYDWHPTTPSPHFVASRDQPMQILNPGPNVFRSNNQFATNGGLPGVWQYQQGAMTVCCINFSVPGAKMIKPTDGDKSVSAISMLEAYPNPTAPGTVNIKYRFSQPGKVSVSLYDALGRRMGIWFSPFENATHTSQMPIPIAVTPGVYVVKATNGNENLTLRLVVSQ